MRSPDTDVFLLLVAFADKINCPLYMETVVRNNRRIIDIKKVNCALGGDVSRAVLGLHCFTGCDTTSAFMRRGKVNPLNLKLHSDKYIAAFQNLGVEEQMSQELFSNLESFTCLINVKKILS